MADLPNRMNLELRFARNLGRINGKFKREFERALGNPPNLNNIPPDLWERMENELYKQIYFMLLLLAAQSSYQHGFSESAATTFGNAYASRKAREFASAVISSSRSAAFELRDVIIQHNIPGATPNLTVSQASGKLFNTAVLERKVVTETTRAVNTAAEAAVKALNQDDKDDTWITENDRRVCPVCKKFYGTKRQTWSRLFPNGPPAHDRCRCYIRYVNQRGRKV